jgi:hypothetical protein
MTPEQAAKLKGPRLRALKDEYFRMYAVAAMPRGWVPPPAPRRYAVVTAGSRASWGA